VGNLCSCYAILELDCFKENSKTAEFDNYVYCDNKLSIGKTHLFFGITFSELSVYSLCDIVT